MPRNKDCIWGLLQQGLGIRGSELGHHSSALSLSLAAQKVSIRRPLADVETFEKQTATFLLELSHAGVPGVWTRGGVRVKPSARCRVSATGCTHSLTLEGLALEDSGTITFTADTLRCSARLLVRGTALGNGVQHWGCDAKAEQGTQPSHCGDGCLAVGSLPVEVPRERSPLLTAEIPQALLSVPVPQCQCISLTDPSHHTVSPQSLPSAW